MKERYIRVTKKSLFGLPSWRPKSIGSTMSQIQVDKYKDIVTNIDTCTTYRRNEIQIEEGYNFLIPLSPCTNGEIRVI